MQIKSQFLLFFLIAITSKTFSQDSTDLLSLVGKDQPKKDKLSFKTDSFKATEIGDLGGNIGSNCWAVSG